jgi:hypothetical protein
VSEFSYELADVIEEAFEPHLTRTGDLDLSSQGAALVAARAVEEHLVKLGMA